MIDRDHEFPLAHQAQQLEISRGSIYYLLRQEDVSIGRRHVATLMKRMGLEAIYRRPNTSKPAAGHKIYPYLLHKLAVTRPIPKFGRPISRTCPWRAVSSIWSLSSIGLPGGCWLGGRRSQWM
jgi:putative transposase